MRRLSTLLVLLCGLLHWSHADGKCDKLQKRIQKDTTRFVKHQCEMWECGEIEGQECAAAGSTCKSASGSCGAGQECCLKTDTGPTGTPEPTGPTEPTVTTMCSSWSPGRWCRDPGECAAVAGARALDHICSDSPATFVCCQEVTDAPSCTDVASTSPGKVSACVKDFRACMNKPSAGLATDRSCGDGAELCCEFTAP